MSSNRNDLDQDQSFPPSIEQSYVLHQSVVGPILHPVEPVQAPLRPGRIHWFEAPLGMVIETEAGQSVHAIRCNEDIAHFNALLEALIRPELGGRVGGNC